MAFVLCARWVVLCCRLVRLWGSLVALAFFSWMGCSVLGWSVACVLVLVCSVLLPCFPGGVLVVIRLWFVALRSLVGGVVALLHCFHCAWLVVFLLYQLSFAVLILSSLLWVALFSCYNRASLSWLCLFSVWCVSFCALLDCVFLPLLGLPYWKLPAGLGWGWRFGYCSYCSYKGRNMSLY